MVRNFSLSSWVSYPCSVSSQLLVPHQRPHWQGSMRSWNALVPVQSLLSSNWKISVLSTLFFSQRLDTIKGKKLPKTSVPVGTRTQLHFSDVILQKQHKTTDLIYCPRMTDHSFVCICSYKQGWVGKKGLPERAPPVSLNFLQRIN